MTPRRIRNTGNGPRDKSIPVGVEYANGMTAKQSLPGENWRWSITGHPFDIAWYWRTDGKGEEQTEERSAA